MTKKLIQLIWVTFLDLYNTVTTFHQGILMNFFVFTKDQINKANQQLIQAKQPKTSSLPPRIVNNINKTRFSKEELNSAFAQALALQQTQSKKPTNEQQL